MTLEMDTMDRKFCTSCKLEINITNTPISPMTVKFDLGRYGIAYCRSCSERVDKVLSKVLISTFNAN